jgi:hypothetical protein
MTLGYLWPISDVRSPAVAGHVIQSALGGQHWLRPKHWMICESVTQPSGPSMRPNTTQRRVTYVEWLYASSTLPRMNSQPLHLAASEPES